MTDLSVHPDAHRLKREITDLRTRLAEAFERTLRMEEIEGPALRARYHDQLGPFQLEILQLRFENAAVERKIERIMRSHQRGTPLTRDRLRAIDREIERELEDWREEIHTKEKRVHESRRERYERSFVDRDENSTRCRTLYRHLCLALHPELGAEREHEFEAWWRAIEKAYVRGDVDDLELIAFALEIDPEEGEAEGGSTPDELSLGDLKSLRRERNRLKERLREEENHHESLREQPPLSYRSLLNDSQALDDKRASLKRRAASLRERRNRLRALLARRSPTDSPSTPVRAVSGP